MFSIQLLKRKVTEIGPHSEKEKQGQRRKRFPIHKERIRERGDISDPAGDKGNPYAVKVKHALPGCLIITALSTPAPGLVRLKPIFSIFNAPVVLGLSWKGCSNAQAHNSREHLLNVHTDGIYICFMNMYSTSVCN